MSAEVVVLLHDIADDFRQRAAADSALAEKFERLADLLSTPGRAGADSGGNPVTSQTWRERLWDAPPQTLLSINDAAEATGLSRSNIHARCSEKSTLPPIPHERLDGRVMLRAGKLRTWLQQCLVIEQDGPEETAAAALVEARLRQAAARRCSSTHTHNGA